MKAAIVTEMVIGGNIKQIASAITEAINSGCTPEEIMIALTSAIDLVGRKYKTGKVFVPEILMASKAMRMGVEALKPHMYSCQQGSLGKAIVGTVSGDLHDIGKNLVALMLESVGFEVIDLGIDVPAEKYLVAYEQNDNIKIIACSAVLTTSLNDLKQTVAAINAEPWRKGVKIMVGGNSVNQNLAEAIGADVYTPDAASAAQKAKELVIKDSF